jgi:hypothetical protein
MANILPSLFREPQGYLVTDDPDPTKSTGQKARTEHTTISCGHCNKIVIVKAMCSPQDVPYALCWGCRRNICLACDNERSRTLKCDVIEKKLERWEAADRLRRAAG